MSILTTSNIGLSFGAFDVFSRVTVSIPNDGKIGLIGPNGIGKTSLLLIMAGQMPATTGAVHLARGRRLGYLRQEAVEAFADRDNALFAEMLTAFEALRAQEARLRELEARMAAGDHTPESLAEYGAAQAAFEHAGGYAYEQRITQTLEGLGFEKSQHAMPLRHLSGGQKTRALLARLLLEQPDLLILDEPTNHLDADAVEWLERALREWPGALLVVSHDRYFLDNVVNTIWEMSRAGMEVFHGNYTAYLNQRDERYERQVQVFAEEKARLLKEIDFVQRNIARASTNARAVGLLKRVHRDLLIIETYGLQALRSDQSWLELGISLPSSTIGVVDAIRQINALEAPSNRRLRLKVRLKPERVSGELVVRTYGLQVGYPGNPLFLAPDVVLTRGECAAVIGPNGAGKTTFLKTLLGQLPPLAGHVKLGASLQVGYFAQAQDALDVTQTVIEELRRHRYMPDGEARSYLAQYLFRGEDVYKRVEALSGGERARLALAILALEGANLLLLDEPTNHLDIPAQEVLQEVLENFAGTILLVSHDRYLIDRLGTQIWEVRAGQLTVFAGTYKEWAARKTETRPPAEVRPAAPPPPVSKVALAPERGAKKRARALADLEEKVALKEAELATLGDLMQSAGEDHARVRALGEDYAYAQTELEQLLAAWEALAAPQPAAG
ncbi:MAG: ABC-F family ATP-binding cassette domain-containing protein [Anaerolineales bacterium]|nr:ABC-F family ATP-binding cassette domain-containing protein [Anaerolineales bacterium]